MIIGPMPPYRGGIARFSASLAEQLLDMGHDVKVISFRKKYPKILYPGKTEKDVNPRKSVKSNDMLVHNVTSNEAASSGKTLTYWLIEDLNSFGTIVKV